MKVPVAVIGAGPVGLYQALSLQRAGIEALLLERRAQPHRGSRSIGIHPPSLELLSKHGLASRFIHNGVCVRRGHAFGDAERLGAVDFGRMAGRFPFVLTLPQHQTEMFLSEALEEVAPCSVQRGAELQSVRMVDESIKLETSAGPVEAKWAIACDGRYSRTRDLLGVGFDVRRYEGAYAMEDHFDQTDFGSDAAVFLTKYGLVESFPLPGARRRWVARVGEDDFQSVIAERTGVKLPRSTSGTRIFHAERGLANRLVQGRVVFGGDAAHVVSPIGGQGMNLGWLGAEGVTRALTRALAGDEKELARDGQVRAKTAKAAMRRAEVNMWLGRPTQHWRLRELLVKALVRPPWVKVLSQAFTMRGLEWGV